MSKKTLEQERAGHALKCVERLKGTNLAGRYRSYAESLPAHTLMGGLGQAVATELAAARLADDERNRDDSNRAHEKLVRDLEEWLGEKVYVLEPQEQARELGWLPGAIVNKDQSFYLRAQAEALAWLVWLKKFCQASLPKAAED